MPNPALLEMAENDWLLLLAALKRGPFCGS